MKQRHWFGHPLILLDSSSWEQKDRRTSVLVPSLMVENTHTVFSHSKTTESISTFLFIYLIVYLFGHESYGTASFLDWLLIKTVVNLVWVVLGGIL